MSIKTQVAKSHTKPIDTSKLITGHFIALERRNPAPPTRTLIQASLTRKSWQATRPTPPTERKLHNKENTTNCQNTERPPQTQQYKQDEETEEYPAGKGTG